MKGTKEVTKVYHACQVRSTACQVVRQACREVINLLTGRPLSARQLRVLFGRRGQPWPAAETG